MHTELDIDYTLAMGQQHVLVRTRFTVKYLHLYTHNRVNLEFFSRVWGHCMSWSFNFQMSIAIGYSEGYQLLAAEHDQYIMCLQ